MHNYLEEVDGNFERFYGSIPKEIETTFLGLSAQKDKFRDSYRRLVSLQAWRGELIENIVSADAELFFKEAQNDAIMSHSLARQGAWRVALMSLRSCIENILYGIYYKDHPIELLQWKNSNFRIGFTETIGYLSKHPALEGLTEQDCALDVIKTEYSTLSKAVHASTNSFRVTKTGEIEGLNIVSLPDLGAWATRERVTLIALNYLLITVFREHLLGAANLNLRKSISLVIPEKKHPTIKEIFKVNLRPLPA